MAFESVFLQAFIYLAAALVAVVAGKRLGLGAVLGYLIIGAAIGPWGLGWIGGESEQVTHFAEFGVVVMLFLVGLEMRPTELWRMRRQIFGLGGMQVVLCALGLAGAAVAFGCHWKPALAMGMILAMSSTAIVLQSLAEKNLLRTEAGQNSFAVLLFQDLAVIPIIALLPLLATGAAHGTAGHASHDWMEGWPAWGRGLVTVGAVVLVVVIARLATRPLFRAIAKTRQREAFTAAALMLIIGIALLMTKVGLSAALGTFVAGVVLANSEYRHELESDLEPFKGLLLGLFFLGVGVGIDFGHIGRFPGTVLGLAAGLIVVKAVMMYALARLHRSPREPSFVFAAALAGGGEFAFVLIGLALGSGVFDESQGKTLTAGVAISMAATPLLILASHRLTARSMKKPVVERESDVQDEGAPVIICGFGRFGHIIGRLLRTQGIHSTVLDNDPDQVDTLRAIGMPVFFGDAGRPDMLLTAGAARAKILVIALKDVATTLNIVETARKHFPHLKIFLRAHSRAEAYELLDAGEERIYRDTLDTSLTLATDVLRELGTPAYTAYRVAKLYRRRDEIFLRKMAKHRHKDDDAFISAAREVQRTLDQVMREEPGHDFGDEGWVPPGADPNAKPSPKPESL
ncbi:monovalent cation:proton antiporter-2 (CPA2) family protein [Luteolibacter sp. LG18]|uniref:monovalent cation:proton antiporter-2 (CPA2) family protein n=1 Tax=Luteolibacter sp. LG18 TaxID=2819286 RepID=UPI0030C7737A